MDEIKRKYERERKRRYRQQKYDKLRTVLERRPKALKPRKWKSGLDLEDWQTLFRLQDKRCRICGTDTARQWSTDHCHGSNHIRGILCHPCNAMLGFAMDNPRILRAGAEYLDRTTPVRFHGKSGTRVP